MKTVLPTHPAFCYRGFAELHVTAQSAGGTRYPFSSQHAVDTPNAGIYFQTDACALSIGLRFADKEQMPGRVDFAGETVVLCENLPIASIARTDDRGGSHWVSITHADRTLRSYEIALSYADHVEFLGLKVDEQAGFQTIPIPNRPLYIAYGDSITQGFHATDSTANYPRQIAQTQQWDLLNLGFGSHRAVAQDAEAILAHQPDFLSVLIGINDCYNKVPLEQFMHEYGQLIQRLAEHPGLGRLFIVTPLPVPSPNWGITPESIERYRQIIRTLAAQLPQKNITLIEGPSLLPSTLSLYQDGLHPNNEGFAVMAQNLNRAMTAAMTR